MYTEPTEIALAHLQRLKDELGNELSAIEEKIAEAEANMMTRRNRIEELASVLSTLTNLDSLIQNGIDVGPSDSRAHVQILAARQNLQCICKKTEQETFEANGEDKLITTYNVFRVRLMNTLNVLDLIAATMRKQNDLTWRKSNSSRRQNNIDSGTMLKGHLGSSAIIRSQELQRQRIAREIHDGPAQAIANVVLRMDILSKVIDMDPSRATEELARMKDIAQGSLDEIRGFIFDLRPMTLQDLGLVATLKRIVGSLKDQSGMDVRFIVEGDERQLGQLVTLAVFRIAQEAINNLRKHSKCRTAWISMKYLQDKVILIVEDDGQGFDIDEVDESQKKFITFGLLGMKERADDINAEFEIKSSRGEGTKVVLVVPTEGNPALHSTWEENK